MSVTFAIPDTQEGFEEILSDAKKRDELFSDPKTYREFMSQYTKMLYQRDPGLKDQLKEAALEGMREFYEQAGAPEGVVKRLPMHEKSIMGEATVGTDGDLSHIYGDLKRHEKRQIAATGRGPGVEFAGQYKTFGEFLQHVARQTTSSGTVVKDLNESELGAGGAVVPEEFRAELLRLSLEMAVVRPRARVIPMGSASLRIPAIKDTSHASTVFGGVSASWVGEGGSVATVTQPTFSQVLLNARKLTGYTVASNELLSDAAISLEALVTSLFADAIAYFEDDAFITGTGAGQPLGVINADALVSQAAETGQDANTILYENIIKAYSRMLPQSIGRAVWYCHPDTFPQLAQMALTVGTGGSAVWISNVQGGPPATIFGRPVIVTEKAETVGTAGDIVFADFSFYLIGDRQSLQVAASPHANFTTDEMTWRFVQRVDGRPWIQSALTPRNGSTTLSPFVSIATRS